MEPEPTPEPAATPEIPSKALDWGALFQSGSVVDLNVSVWAARLGIKPADLGIENLDSISRALSLGHHRLLPKICFDRINQVVSEAKIAVDRSSLPFGLIRGARYVPEKNIKRLLDELRVCRDRFEEEVEKFVDEYNAAKEQMLPVIRQAILDAARDTSVIENAMDRVESNYPSAETVRNHFSLKWSMYAIKGPSTKALANEGQAVKDVIKEMMRSLREEVTDDLGKILRLVQTGGKLNARSIESAMKTLERVESLNVLGDEGLARQVAAIRRTLIGVDRSKVDQNTLVGLAAIKDQLEETLDEEMLSVEQRLTGVGQRQLDVS